MAISPLTEPSPGPSAPYPLSEATPYPLTEAKIQRRRRQEKQDQHIQFEQHKYRLTSTPKVCPPKVKRFISTEPLKVPLAHQPTQAWSAKQHTRKESGESSDSIDIFSRASIQRRLRAEASWWKANERNKLCTKAHTRTHKELSPTTVKSKKSIPNSSFRRLVGGFSPPTSSHHAVDGSVDEKMAHVMEELSERLEDIETIM
jgi:hypothetical protein